MNISKAYTAYTLPNFRNKKSARRGDINLLRQPIDFSQYIKCGRGAGSVGNVWSVGRACHVWVLEGWDPTSKKSKAYGGAASAASAAILAKKGI